MMMFIARILALVLAFLVCAACTPVAPWQRGTLAKDSMALEANPMDKAMRSHIYGSREAAIPAGAAAGGGCGCY